MKNIGVEEEVHNELWELKYELRASSLNEVIKELLRRYREGEA